MNDDQADMIDRDTLRYKGSDYSRVMMTDVEFATFINQYSAAPMAMPDCVIWSAPDDKVVAFVMSFDGEQCIYRCNDL